MNIKTHYRACHLCEAICGLEIQTQGDEILSIKGDKLDPLSRGHICPKAIALKDLHTDPDRLRHPVKRVGTEWQTIGWDEALTMVAENLCRIQDQYGNNAVAFYAGNPSVHNYGNMTHGGLLRRAVQTNNNFSATSLDQLPHQLIAYVMYGHQFLLPVPDIDRTDFMLILGANPLASNGSMMTVPDVKKRLKSIQQRGGTFVVIDPRRTETAEIADQHLFIKPGTDAYLLMAMLNTLFDEDLVNINSVQEQLIDLDKLPALFRPFTAELAEQQTTIPAQTIRNLARTLARTPKAVCYGRMGVSVQQYGTLCQWALQLLNILTNHLDVEGGALLASPAFGYIAPDSASGAGNFGRRHSRVSGLPEFSGEFPSVAMAEEMLNEGEGQVRGLITMAGNPVLSAPNGTAIDTALEQLDFMVSIDFYINASTQHADVILPPTGPLEHDHFDVAFHRLAVHNTVRYNEPMFEPEEGQLHDWEIINRLSAKIAALKNIDLRTLPAPKEILNQGIRHGHYGVEAGHPLALDLDKIRQHPHGLDLGPLKPSLSSRLCTHDGMIHLMVDFLVEDLSRLELAAQESLTKASDQQDNNLLLIGRRHVRSNNSWMHNYTRLVKGKPRWQLLMHPDDMQSHQLKDNDEVRIQSRVGAVVTTVLASDEIMPGVISLPHGWGHQRPGIKMAVAVKQQGVSANDLCDDKFFDPVTGNAALNGVPVTVAAV